MMIFIASFVSENSYYIIVTNRSIDKFKYKTSMDTLQFFLIYLNLKHLFFAPVQQ